MSGTEVQLGKRLLTYKKMAHKHIERRERKDAQGTPEAETKERFEKRQKQLGHRIEKISNFLEKMKKKEGRHVQEM
jgi:hypothetical protein